MPAVLGFPTVLFVNGCSNSGFIGGDDDASTVGNDDIGEISIEEGDVFYLDDQATEEAICLQEEMSEEEIVDLAISILTTDQQDVVGETDSSDFSAFQAVSAAETEGEDPVSDESEFGSIEYPDTFDSLQDPASFYLPGDTSAWDDAAGSAEQNALQRFDEAGNMQLNQLNEIYEADPSDYLMM